MDGWENWRVVCLAALSLEDVEDIYLFGTLITGFLLMGNLGGARGYRRLGRAVRNSDCGYGPQNGEYHGETSGFATDLGQNLDQRLSQGRAGDNKTSPENKITRRSEFLVPVPRTPVWTGFGLHRLTHTHTQLQIDNSLPYPISHAFVCFFPPRCGWVGL
ncbi:hypothetical protein QQF64_018327 [Cirrhinus molitorella]|uniref:Uncharacterized protein n=1 Tax=Cirrhinus molitorella TaxID=172907 RepID=A0ABR3LEL7_9TELE